MHEANNNEVTVLESAHGGQKGVEIWRLLSVHLHDPMQRIETVAMRRRPMVPTTHVHAARSLRLETELTNSTMRLLKHRAAPVDKAASTTCTLQRRLDAEAQLGSGTERKHVEG